MVRVMRALPMVCAVILAAAPLRAQRRSSVITAEEIERAGPNVSTAYDAVRTLRPRWLDAPREILRLPGSGRDARMARVHAYLNDRDMGDVEYLRTIPAQLVLTLRWMSTNEAGARLGPSEGPVIVVTLKR